jgi:hypothetical protein
MTDLFPNLNPNVAWLKDRSIFITKHGSHAYGTNTPESDEDFRGVAIPPENYFLGFNHKFEQYECKTPDVTIWGIHKFLSLAAQNNPNVLEILFTDPSDHVYVSKLGKRLLEHKEMFISRQAKERFLGYARAQAHRIKTHKRWITNPPKQPPTRAEFGLQENVSIPKPQFEAVLAAVRKKVDSWNVDFEPFTDAQTIYLQGKMSEILTEMSITTDSTWSAAARTLGMSENFIRILQLEREYDGKKTDWDNYLNWKKTRNPKRAALEEKYLYDTKHGMHLVRLTRMAKEILLYGQVNVKRPDAIELLSIRNGAWSFDFLIAYVEQIQKEIEAAYATSLLRAKPDQEAIDQLCISLIKESFTLRDVAWV